MGVRYPAMSEAQRDEVLAVDVVVVGAGAAGLYAALTAAEGGGRVALVSATPLAQTASYWAQGGLAAALAVDDSPELHLADTETAGRGLMRRSAGEVLVEQAPRLIGELQRCASASTPTARATSRWGSRAGTRARRIVHAGGSAPAAASCASSLRTSSAARESGAGGDARLRPLALGWSRRRRRVRRRPRRRAHAGRSSRPAAPRRCGARTTNPPGSMGIGMLLALKAGARLADIELCSSTRPPSRDPGREGFLVTEAIRGEGATLHGPDGERFVEELAPARRGGARDLGR